MLLICADPVRISELESPLPCYIQRIEDGRKERIGLEKGKGWAREQWEEMSKKEWKEGNEGSRMPQRSEKQSCDWKWRVLVQVSVQSGKSKEGSTVKPSLICIEGPAKWPTARSCGRADQLLSVCGEYACRLTPSSTLTASRLLL